MDKLKQLTAKANEILSMTERLEALEKRVAALEAELSPKSSRPCPSCGFPLFPIIETRDAGPFSALGGKIHVRSCPRCHFKDENSLEP